MEHNTFIVIQNVKEYKKYKGKYKKIFQILNNDSIFVERYEADSSVGFINGTYFLEIEGTLDWSQQEEIEKLRNVKIVDKEFYEELVRIAK